MTFTPGDFSKGEKNTHSCCCCSECFSSPEKNGFFVFFMLSDQCKSAEQGLQPAPKTTSNSHCELVELTREPS